MTVVEEQPEFIVCPRCHRRSYNRNDIWDGYCGACHDWTSPGRKLSSNGKREEDQG